MSESKGWIARHPWVFAIFGGCALAGAVAGALFLTDDWSLARRIAAGAVAGAGVAVMVTGPTLMTQ